LEVFVLKSWELENKMLQIVPETELHPEKKMV
jgi:hypothetical protein